MEIVFVNQTNDQGLKGYYRDFKAVFNNATKILKLDKDLTINVIFVRSRKIHTINKEYRGIDRPTDVITFALNDAKDDYEVMENDKELGDIFINIDYAKKQAKEYGHSYRRELSFLFTHGLLHALGYDHMNASDERKMIAMQSKILDPLIKR